MHDSIPRRSLGLVLLLAGLAALVWAGAGWLGGVVEPEVPSGAVSRGPASLVLVTLDTTRPDRLEPYGADDVETPHLANLADEGILFRNAYSVAPITLVSHTSIVTGLEPPAHGVRNNGIHTVPPEAVTLAERLRKEGWGTAAFVSAAVLDRRYGLDQGFDLYDDDLSQGRERHPRMVADRPAEATVGSALRWLEEDAPRDRPFFLWVHLYDPHAPYSPPAPFRDRYRERPYDGEIAYMDSELGRLLEHPRMRDSLISVLGDHGESLGEHGEQTHALLAYDSTLRVPWILRIPGGPSGEVTRPVGQVDLLPTLLDLLQLESPDEELPGRSLLPLLEGDRRPLDRDLYAETWLPYYTYGWSKLQVLRRGSHKWIDAPTPELYDTSRDPRELSNLREQEPGLAHDLARDLRERLERFPENPSTELALDGDARERLRSLGYLGVAATPEPTGGERPDPKELVDLHVRLERARHLMRDRLWTEAVAELRAALERDPGNLAALIDLTTALAEQGLLEDARETAERALELDPDHPRLHLLMADVERRDGRLDRALDLLETAVDLDPRSVEARLQRAALLHRTGSRTEARAALEELLADEPDSASVEVLYARLVELPEDPEAALERVETALTHDPFHAEAWLLRGEILESRGRTEAARESYREGLKRRPDDPELHARMGLLLARSRAGAEAESHLREAIRLSPVLRPELHVALGGWLAEHGHLREAEGEYDRVLRERPGHPGARNNRAVALYRTGRLEEAERELEALVEEYPEHADALNNLAAVSLDQQQWAEAERRAEAAIARSPEMAEAWNNLGLAREKQGRLEEARKAYERSLSILPDYWAAELNLGLVLTHLDRPGRAAEVLSDLLRRHPALPDAHLALARLYRDELGEPDRAKAHYNAFLRHAPDHPEAEAARTEVAELAGAGA